mmetsp:Transcript_81189/g.169597  ORF Transcript_81189/g.169597 Transcript_81189/m.169597 type:complete len:122 (-) Transcript_81189:1420-1785(-)
MATHGPSERGVDCGVASLVCLALHLSGPSEDSNDELLREMRAFLVFGRRGGGHAVALHMAVNGWMDGWMHGWMKEGGERINRKEGRMVNERAFFCQAESCFGKLPKRDGDNQSSMMWAFGL